MSRFLSHFYSIYPTDSTMVVPAEGSQLFFVVFFKLENSKYL